MTKTGPEIKQRSKPTTSNTNFDGARKQPRARKQPGPRNNPGQTEEAKESEATNFKPEGDQTPTKKTIKIVKTVIFSSPPGTPQGTPKSAFQAVPRGRVFCVYAIGGGLGTGFWRTRRFSFFQNTKNLEHNAFLQDTKKVVTASFSHRSTKTAHSRNTPVPRQIPRTSHAKPAWNGDWSMEIKTIYCNLVEKIRSPTFAAG